MIVDRAERECPSDEQLAAWIEGRGPETARDALAAHVAACHACADVVATAMPLDERPVAERVADVSTASAASTAPARRRTLRWAVAASVLLATTAAAYAALDIARTRARDTLAARASAALGQPVTIGDVGLALRDRGRTIELRLREPRVAGGDAFAATDVAVQVPLASLVARAPEVSRVVMAGATIVLRATGDEGRFGLRVGGANAVAAVLAGAPFELIDSTVRIESTTATVQLQDVGGTTTPGAEGIAITLAATLGDAHVTIDGNLAIDDTGPLALTIAARDTPSGTLPWITGRVAGTADVFLRISGTPREPVFAGRLLVREGRAHGWNPVARVLGPEGTTAIRVAAPDLAGDDLRFDELRVVFASSPDGWRIPRVFVTNAAFVAGASLQIGTGATLTGEGTVQLSPPVAAAVVNAVPALADARDAGDTLTVPFTVSGSLAAPRIVPAPPAS